MGFGFKQPLVGEKRCVTTLITAAKETRRMEARISFTPFLFTPLLRNGPIVRQLYSSNILMFYSPSKISDFLELTFHEIFFPCFFYSGYQSHAPLNDFFLFQKLSFGGRQSNVSMTI